jgi:hypothetical protein
VLRASEHGRRAGLDPGTISYGPGINTAAVLLSGYGNVPAERTAHLIAMLPGMPVSPGFVDKASSRWLITWPGDGSMVSVPPWPVTV